MPYVEADDDDFSYDEEDEFKMADDLNMDIDENYTPSNHVKSMQIK